MVESVKWVDEVVPRVPYDVSEEFMNELFEARNVVLLAVPRPRQCNQLASSLPQKHNIDYIIHGDDPCLLPVRSLRQTRGAAITRVFSRAMLTWTDWRTAAEFSAASTEPSNKLALLLPATLLGTHCLKKRRPVSSSLP